MFQEKIGVKSTVRCQTPSKPPEFKRVAIDGSCALRTCGEGRKFNTYRVFGAYCCTTWLTAGDTTSFFLTRE